MNDMRDRLVELLKTASYYLDEQDVLCNRIADHLIENGVIVPPCKIGDTVYIIQSLFYFKYKISRLIYDGVFMWAECVNDDYSIPYNKIIRCITYDIGKTIFLTKEEAEKALIGG